MENWKKINKFSEAGLLNLNSEKAYNYLNWKNILNFKETVKLTADWYNFYLNKKKIKEISISQIDDYIKKLIKKKWK